MYQAKMAISRFRLSNQKLDIELGIYFTLMNDDREVLFCH